MRNWTAILPLLGVALGWVLTQTSTWFNARQADKRIVKEVVYSLLELHHLLSRLAHLEANLPVYIASIQQHVPAPPAEMQAAVTEQLTRFIRATALPLASEQLTNLKTEYAACLLKLASVYPVSAFQLRGQENVINMLPQVFEALRQASQTQLEQELPDSPELMHFMQQQLGVDALQEACVTVRHTLDKLARQLDRQTRRELASALARGTQQEHEIESKLNDLMTKAATVFPQSA